MDRIVEWVKKNWIFSGIAAVIIVIALIQHFV